MQPDDVDAKLSEIKHDTRLPGGAIDTEFIQGASAGGAEGEHPTIGEALPDNISSANSVESPTGAEATSSLVHLPHWLQGVSARHTRPKTEPGNSRSPDNSHF